MTRRKIAYCVSVGLYLTNSAAFAAQETVTMDVAAYLEDTCDVSVTGLNFGSFENTVEKTAEATLSINCSNPSDFTLPSITIGAGQNYNAETGLRNMLADPISAINPTPTSGPYTSREGLLPYKVGFAAGENAAPDFVQGPIALTMNDSSRYVADVTLYGTTVPVQNSYVGAYGDSVTVTVTYAAYPFN